VIGDEKSPMGISMQKVKVLFMCYLKELSIMDLFFKAYCQ
jgi:hypothetical protein